MFFRRIAVLVCGFVVSTSTPALAQMAWTEKGFAALSTGVQIGTSDVSNTQSFDLYGETATLSSAQDIKGGLFFDGQFGYRVWRNLAVGVGVTFLQGKSEAGVTASVPDPIFTDRNRTTSVTATDLTRREIWYAAQLTWVMPLTDKIDVFFTGGPAMVQVQQELPTSGTVTEPGPSLSDVTVTNYNKNGLGFVVGADVRYMITPRFGVGALAKFSAATVEIVEGAKSDAGGFQIGGGVRIKF
ncbi:MAG: porin family protein [Acidobacteriota bacterium]|nr:porin family protein [Acidobacteriota bacterium]